MFRKLVVVSLGVLVVVPMIIASLTMQGCERAARQVVEPERETVVEESIPVRPVQPDTPYWGNNIVSEAYYALSQSRSGGSSRQYGGWLIGDWDYLVSDTDADRVVTAYTGGCGIPGRGGYGTGVGIGWQCKYFANLVLYRSSYGLGRYHLGLPRDGQPWANRPATEAQAGLVIHKESPPHTAIVVVRNGSGLDVVDSNWVLGNTIGRHFYRWDQLGGFGAYCPWTGSPGYPVTYIDQYGPRTPCQ